MLFLFWFCARIAIRRKPVSDADDLACFASHRSSAWGTLQARWMFSHTSEAFFQRYFGDRRTWTILRPPTYIGDKPFAVFIIATDSNIYVGAIIVSCKVTVTNDRYNCFLRSTIARNHRKVCALTLPKSYAFHQLSQCNHKNANT